MRAPLKNVVERKLIAHSDFRDILECGHYVVVKYGELKRSKRRCDMCRQIVAGKGGKVT